MTATLLTAVRSGCRSTPREPFLSPFPVSLNLKATWTRRLAIFALGATLAALGYALALPPGYGVVVFEFGLLLASFSVVPVLEAAA